MVWSRPCYLLPCNVSSGDCWQRPADTRKGWDKYFSFWYYFCLLIVIIIFDVENYLVFLFLCLFVCFCLNFSSWRHFPSVCYFFLPIAVTSYKQCCRLQWCHRVILWVVGNIYIITFKYLHHWACVWQPQSSRIIPSLFAQVNTNCFILWSTSRYLNNNGNEITVNGPELIRTIP